jgi:hypothetical protein
VFVLVCKPFNIENKCLHNFNLVQLLLVYVGGDLRLCAGQPATIIPPLPRL